MKKFISQKNIKNLRLIDLLINQTSAKTTNIQISLSFKEDLLMRWKNRWEYLKLINYLIISKIFKKAMNSQKLLNRNLDQKFI